MALAKVQARGQVTLPRAIRREAGIRPGDTVFVTATGPNTVELRVLPRMTLAEALERYQIEEPIDWERDREGMEVQAAEEVIRGME